ncbi:MAG TPA: RagB/SusD family nutrient uptake outer membrane protein [Bacteroidales bacterium]
MKKLIIFSLLIFVLFSCGKDFLNEKKYGLVVPSTYPQSLNALEKCVNALYSISNSMYNETGCYEACLAGDEITTQAGGNKQDFLAFDQFNTTNNNGHLDRVWNPAYLAIKQANVIINSIDNVTQPDQLSALVSAQKSRALGQAYFIRALAYFNLVRIWGQVPIQDQVVVDYNAKKASYVDIYNHIVSDLTKAIPLLPSNYKNAPYPSDLEKTTSYARITCGAAQTLLASVYLFEGGYPVKDNTKFTLARDLAKAVMDSVNAGVYSYQLLPSYADLWKASNGENSKAINNAEDVFTFFYNNWAGDWSDNGTSSNGNMLAPAAFTPGIMGGWDDAYAELNFYKEFPAGPRKNATFITYVHLQVNNKDSIVPWTSFQFAHPYFKKFMEVSGFDTTNMGAYIDWWSARTVQVIRYAEVLLIYAESQARADGTPNSLAYSCLNQVRNRAGLANMTNGLSSTAFADSVVMERKWEFAGPEPCNRWYDMVRTETVASATSKRDPSEQPIINQPNDETHAGYWAPIPLRDAALNPNL